MHAEEFGHDLARGKLFIPVSYPGSNSTGDHSLLENLGSFPCFSSAPRSLCRYVSDQLTNGVS